MGKDFKNKIGGKRLDSLIPPESQAQSSPGARESKQISSSSNKEPKKENKPELTTVATFRVNTEKLSHIKAIAYWDRKKIQDVFDEALQAYLDNVPTSTLNKAKEEYKKSIS